MLSNSGMPYVVRATLVEGINHMMGFNLWDYGQPGGLIIKADQNLFTLARNEFIIFIIQPFLIHGGYLPIIFTQTFCLVHGSEEHKQNDIARSNGLQLFVFWKRNQSVKQKK